MKVLVTGGAGFIGSHLAGRLAEEGHQLVVLDDLSSGKRDQVPGAASFYQMDVASRWTERVVAREKPEAVCHLAAQISVSRSMQDPLFDAHVNILGSLGLLEACRRHGVRRFVFVSTGGAMYGDAETIPTPESYPAAPVSAYGASKLGFEHYLHVFHSVDGLSYAAMRLANVYGPRQDPRGEAGVVAIFSQALLEGRTPVINGDGLQTRDYVYVGDVVNALVAALTSDAVGAFNVGTGLETDVNTLYARLREAAGSEVEATHGAPRPGEQRRSCLDATRARETFGWQPRFILEEGLRETVEYFRGQVALGGAAAS